MEQLGRYLLDRKLAQGGMAEVFLAKQLGPGGYEKVCVVKRMLPHLSEDLTFIEMFLDEARLAARLSHPGICQILDFGHERDTYYLALEYVAGANLKSVLEQRLEVNKPIPLPVAARLVSLIALALDYAHHAHDETGRPLDLIHRDVSPQNIMVGLNGDVKVIDFGIAKAATDSHRTVAGVLKGKYAYMSPEQLRQGKVDQRTDIYAVGLVLYELITGRPAVAPNENMNALMMAAAMRKYPPIDQFRPETPKRLRQILDRALALDPNDRFPRARELSEELEEFLVASGTRVKPGDIALLVDPKLVSTDPMATPAPKPLPKVTSRPPIPLHDEAPPTVVGSSGRERSIEREARTVLNLERPKDMRETIASRLKKDDPDRTPMAGSSAVEQRPLAPPVAAPIEVDHSMDPTPIVGTPAVARRAVTDVSLMPTEPEKAAPDIAAAMARPPRRGSSPSHEPKRPSAPAVQAPDPNAPQLEAETSPSVPKPVFVPGPVTANAIPLVNEAAVPKTAISPPPSVTGSIAKPAGAPRGPRRWPWILLIVVLLPIGAVAGAIEFLPKDSPVRAKLLDVVGPVLAKLKR